MIMEGKVFSKANLKSFLEAGGINCGKTNIILSRGALSRPTEFFKRTDRVNILSFFVCFATLKVNDQGSCESQVILDFMCPMLDHQV